jgi:hypothetical protein
MKSETNGGKLGPFLFGMALGAGAVALQNAWERRHPESSAAQRRTNRALDQALQEARNEGVIALDSDSRYIIFSDQHKGARTKADDFLPCEGRYLAALDYYYEHGHSLIVLGDAEELWEEDPEGVFASYPNVFQREARFHPDRYLRVVGNHDDAWENPELVERYLAPIYPGIQIHRGLVLRFSEGGEISGELFLTHGHQGTLGSDVLDFISPSVVTLMREVQKATGLFGTTPRQDACLRAERDTQLYRWSTRQGNLVLITGHTHRPVWSSRTHLEKLTWELAAMRQIEPQNRPPEYPDQVARLIMQIKAQEGKSPPCTDTIKTRPSYFNTGCCCFADGDITGMEIEGGHLRLVKWGEGESGVERTVLEAAPLVEVFSLLGLKTAIVERR